ncbi:hypothetical protein OIU76_015056 [Salix suchowensis]|uniref:Uncharacterized protein n=2 Tax=Salix TaxID=40685 RepID=A0A9Q0TR75_9ROSI|nr:hypothetical protein OIU76_015056 [Salix suchowensis]KAJ6345584.1 hypothetical protein OIU78_008273 [Salix suchowensis]KAJ6409326.1 hypothetical protein OIU84_008923 [Salix udensis]KAJ6716331.1 hypothetical protein OIU74_008958 [Salix koriyanagi]
MRKPQNGQEIWLTTELIILPREWKNKQINPQVEGAGLSSLSVSALVSSFLVAAAASSPAFSSVFFSSTLNFSNASAATVASSFSPLLSWDSATS